MPKDPGHASPRGRSGSVGEERLTVTPPPAPVLRDQEGAWEEIAQISKNVRGLISATNSQAQYVRQIPEIKQAARDAKAEAVRANQAIALVDTKLSTEFKNLDRRVEKVENRAHDCAQVPTIAELRETTLEIRRRVEEGAREGVKTQERLTTTRDDVGELDEKVRTFAMARRSVVGALLGLAAFALTTIGSLVWFLAQTDTKVQTEQYERREGYKRLEKQIAEVGRVANTEPVRQEIETLTKAMGDEGDLAAAERFCAGLSNRAVWAMKRALPRADWPKCQRFRGKVR